MGSRASHGAASGVAAGFVRAALGWNVTDAARRMAQPVAAVNRGRTTTMRSGRTAL